MPIKIAIADDHQLFRQGLITLLSNSDEIEVVGQAENGEEAIESCLKLKPDILLMDIGMPIMNGIKATGILKISQPNIKVIALSMHSERNFVKTILEAGALGYLMKSCTYTQLRNAITTVYSGKKYLDEEVTEVILQDYLNVEDNLQIDSVLSKREMEVLKLIAEGYSSKETSEKLFVSIKTVGSHRQNILDKLNLKSTTDIVKYALRNNIIDLN